MGSSSQNLDLGPIVEETRQCSAIRRPSGLENSFGSVPSLCDPGLTLQCLWHSNLHGAQQDCWDHVITCATKLIPSKQQSLLVTPVEGRAGMLYLETRFRDRTVAEVCLTEVWCTPLCVLRLRLPWKTSVASKGVSVDKKHVICCIIQRCGRRVGSNLSQIVWVDCTLTLKPEAKDKILYLDSSVSVGEILLLLCARCNPFSVHQRQCCGWLIKLHFLFRRNIHPLEASLSSISCAWSLSSIFPA